MPRLTNLKPRLSSLPPRIGYAPGDEKARDKLKPWKSRYKTARWQKLRWSILVRDLFTCQRCGKVDVSKYGLHCDHIDPTGKDDPDRFWSGPFQTLCGHCHNSVKQSEEGRHGI